MRGGSRCDRPQSRSQNEVQLTPPCLTCYHNTQTTPTVLERALKHPIIEVWVVHLWEVHKLMMKDPRCYYDIRTIAVELQNW